MMARPPLRIEPWQGVEKSFEFPTVLPLSSPLPVCAAAHGCAPFPLPTRPTGTAVQPTFAFLILAVATRDRLAACRQRARVIAIGLTRPSVDAPRH